MKEEIITEFMEKCRTSFANGGFLTKDLNEEFAIDAFLQEKFLREKLIGETNNEPQQASNQCSYCKLYYGNEKHFCRQMELDVNEGIEMLEQKTPITDCFCTLDFTCETCRKKHELRQKKGHSVDVNGHCNMGCC